MFWWNDMANNDDYISESVPDECKSGKKTIAKITAPDDYTLKVVFDTPAPLFPAKIASYSRGYKGNGASWMVPSHFVKQFHGTYNKNVPSDWAAVGRLWETNADYKRNPEVPDPGRIPVGQVQRGPIAHLGAQPVLLRRHQRGRPAALPRLAPDDVGVGPAGRQGADLRRQGRLQPRAVQQPRTV